MPCLKALLFDVDGTLAQMTDRGPFEWGKVDRWLKIQETQLVSSFDKAGGGMARFDVSCLRQT